MEIINTKYRIVIILREEVSQKEGRGDSDQGAFNSTGMCNFLNWKNLCRADDGFPGWGSVKDSQTHTTGLVNQWSSCLCHSQGAAEPKSCPHGCQLQNHTEKTCMCTCSAIVREHWPRKLPPCHRLQNSGGSARTSIWGPEASLSFRMTWW